MEEVEGEPMDTLCTTCAPPDIEELRLHPDRAVDRLNDKLLQLPIKSTLEWCSWMICDAPAPTKPAADAANSGLCGVVWKTGDTVYHCRTCGMDPSCAICHECFMNSDHEGHDYWMFSSGGGCCDCGDVEAWRPEGFCSKHQGTSSDCAQAVAALSQSQRRLAIAFLERITNFLTFFPGSASQSSITSDRVITARWLTNLCASSTGLRVLCGYCVAHQGPLPSHIDQEIPRLDPTSDSNRAELSVLDRLLQSEGRMPLALRDELHHLYFELMRDFQFKQALLCHVIRHYPAFVEQSMVSPPVTFSARDSSSTTFGKFTVQFKGNLVPTMVEQGLLQMLLATLLRVLQSAVSPSPLGLAAGGDQITGSVGSRGTGQGNRDSLRREDDGSSEHRVASGESRGLPVVSVTSAVVQSHLYSQLCYDIRYALNHPPISRKLYSEPRLLPIFLESLELLQAKMYVLDVLALAEQEENSWADAFSLGTEVAHLFPCVISGLGQDLNTISGDAKVEELGWQRARYHEAVQAICSKLDHWIQQEPLDLSKDSRLSEQPFSYHLPLHRFLSAFITYGASALQLPANQLTQSQQSSDIFERIIEHPLRLQLLLSQTRVGLWQALMNVATYVEPHGMLQGKYVLRREAWKRFDPYYPQYSQQELHRALERRARFLPPDAPLPTPHKPYPAFEGLCVAALSGELHALIYCVLAGAARKSRLVSERLLTTALRLVELSAEARAASIEAIREGAMEIDTYIKRPSSAEGRRSDMNDGGRRLRMRTRYGVLHALRALCSADERCRKIAESQLPDLCKASTDAKTSNKNETERRKRAAIMQRFAKQQAAFEENVDPLPLQESPRASNGDEEMPDATDGEVNQLRANR
ncbi:hypothetical protein AB1Y20_022871 [Prymnesium parvum]|uniref:E3 ubiquitin-protein ligase n=1 Tax=Prymnesium parvum TaxID=97485 RepID=A0AB34JBF1_PRYPA